MPMFLAWQHGQGFPKGRGCLKPAWEPIVLARKPGKKVLPLGIAETRVDNPGDHGQRGRRKFEGFPDQGRQVYGDISMGRKSPENPAGRWPPNLLLVHSPLCEAESCDESCVVRTLGEQSGVSKSPRGTQRPDVGVLGVMNDDAWEPRARTFEGMGDTGTAARFFPQFRYCPKASRRDREDGLSAPGAAPHEFLNKHPCVKPTPLLEWLVRLACPEGGTVLDPFMGSGSTGKACMRAGRSFIGIEQDEQWLPVARARIEFAAMDT